MVGKGQPANHLNQIAQMIVAQFVEKANYLMKYKVMGINTKFDSKPLHEFDNDLRHQYGQIIVGIDEVGRGAVAGPIAAAAVILKPDANIVGLTDSKKLTAAKREALYPIIKANALAYDIQYIAADLIDEFGLTWANQEVMLRAAMKVTQSVEKVDLYVIDQSPQFNLKPNMMFPKADSRSLSVAAASVLAKVWRDNYMIDTAKLYPQYKWEDSKGYINSEHKEAIVKYGKIHGLHRFSYNLNLEEYQN